MIAKTGRSLWKKGETSGRLGEPGAEKGIGKKGFPSGLTSVPVNLTLPEGQSIGIDIVAGFFGVEQDPRDLALSPAIGWAVTERAPEKPVMVW
jgi:hypothetical protein